ncbi:bifunctional phosphopantothenoylcysteine decarboxylase/phosphopantothenate--cysteine ligase CoaBC [Candidatus Venteria ishoeyi]|uniref:bifunctional phosphopantothenoylcysteine decarboxylase/phosphopantothenate--cysteine ligase CoaBC n=1 Tax=Candidatus Venteria ishoeyi TaxID=1899563 RepID=UPI0025A5FC62|nr:bifunctional phosphopantothenoylcysteine decarboxylase/phosphopantothenate--cysteine ligase CoaBC [Candidatus Venteria ishoeyi]MDM8545261.1 bifunctional phosphopantothenoylcysteine decarboxylase/phosphopantothenate--cysteine ligase CoaBC [Candidatus Venteria ishoeyi]
MILKNKRILLGVSGSIAAYKVPELVRRLREQGAEIRIVLTSGGAQFITPLTLQAVSGSQVEQQWITDTVQPVSQESSFGHIELARWADLIVIVPASANCMARLAHGFASDLLSTLCLASDAPLAVVPAMNQQMWKAPATQDNIQCLDKRGTLIWGPDSGVQACGETGAGRMLEVSEIIEKINAFWQEKIFSKMCLVITAGTTHEAIDPVRFLSNRSSGKMGYAIARSAQMMGAKVILISGPSALSCPTGIDYYPVESAAQMYQTVIEQITQADIFIAAAAVADYRPVQAQVHKIKKHNDTMHLELERTQDILAAVAALPEAPFTVGFAAETQDLEHYALDKLQRKKLNMIAANPVGKNLGFDQEDNCLSVYWKAGKKQLPRMHKTQLAQQLLQLIYTEYQKHS